MIRAKQKSALTIGVVVLLMVFAAGCDYDHDHYRDYGQYRYDSYSRYAWNYDGWRDRNYDRRYGYWYHRRDRDHDWDRDMD